MLVVESYFITRQPHSLQLVQTVTPTATILKLHHQINHLAFFGQLLLRFVMTLEVSRAQTTVNQTVFTQATPPHNRQAALQQLQLVREWQTPTKYMLVSQQQVALQRPTMPLVSLGLTQTTQKLIGFCHRNLSFRSCTTIAQVSLDFCHTKTIGVHQKHPLVQLGPVLQWVGVITTGIMLEMFSRFVLYALAKDLFTPSIY